MMGGMSDTALIQYRRWLAYERDAHEKMLASLAGASADQRAHPHFQQAIDLAAHLVAARRLWLFRLGGVSEAPRALFPTGSRLADLPAAFAAMHAEWDAYLDAAGAGELDRVFEYTAFEGGRFRGRVDDTLAQLYGHSWYHRGQIAMLLRQIGAEPAVTDFVYWSRKAV
jgi:uncharacterized damage-inducible protein DinB